MLYTYTGAAYFDNEDKFNKIDFSDIEDDNFLKETRTSWISMIQKIFFKIASGFYFPNFSMS
jgi:YidC/Oxa1 family membrane protein insertase